MKKMMKAVCAVAILAAANNAMAESADLTVTGTILPASCIPVLSGGGAVNYGTLKAQTLKADAYTVLDEKQLDLTITCDAKAKVAIKAVNGRPDSVAGAIEGAGGAAVAPAGVTLLASANTPVVGLGLDGTGKIGGYAIAIAGDATIDDSTLVKTIHSNDAGNTWNTTASGSLYDAGQTVLSTVALSGTNEPTAFTSMTSKINVQAYINKSSELDTTKPITLDGLTTLEMVYL